MLPEEKKGKSNSEVSAHGFLPLWSEPLAQGRGPANPRQGGLARTRRWAGRSGPAAVLLNLALDPVSPGSSGIKRCCWKQPDVPEGPFPGLSCWE